MPRSEKAAQDLRRRIRLALEQSGYPQLRDVQVSVADDRVILEGCVCNYYAKQLAQTICLGVDGIERLDNQLDVDRQPDSELRTAY